MVDQKVEGGPAWREGSRGTYLRRVSVCSPLCFLDVEGERLSSAIALFPHNRVLLLCVKTSGPRIQCGRILL